MTNDYLPYWLAALHLPDTGPKSVAKWLMRVSSIKALFDAPVAQLHELGLSDKQIAAINQPDWKAVDMHLKWAEGDDHTIVTLDDPLYPALLKQITDPPLLLFIKGQSTVISKPQIAMVGSRHPSSGGLQNAKQFASALASAGYIVTSGLALGVDGACHRGALAVNGATIGVMGTGLNQVYPLSHRALAADMAVNGAIISEFPLNMKPFAGNFPRRNRLIAGLSLGVLVVEAALRSGSLITAKYAVEQGREVFAIPGSIHQPQSRGCHHLIRQGAKLVETAQDVIDEVGALHTYCQMMMPVKTVIPSMKGVEAHMSGNNQAVYTCIDHEITPIDVIILRTRLTASEVSSILLLLELDGYIQSVSGGYIRHYANP